MLLMKKGFVLNVQTGVFEKKDILVENHQIIKILKDIEQNQCKVVDCENKWIIPGLIDMHVHIKKHFAEYFTAAGITTVRNTAGSVIELKPFMEVEYNGSEPRVISADRMIDGPPGLWGDDSPYNINISDEVSAKKEVQRQVELGADFIKVYGWLEPEYMKEVVDEAKKYGKEVSCDIIYSKKVNALAAAKMGIDWLEHCSGIIQGMYPDWSMDASEEIWNTIPWDQPDEKKIEAICKQLLEKDVKLCPTLVLYDQLRLAEQYWKTDHPIINHIESSPLFQHWYQAAQSKSGQKSIGKQVKMIQKIAYQYYKMGGTVVTGTDTPAGIFTYPGMALHRELQLFVEAGFSPLEAIQQATMNAAKALGVDRLGEIEEGYIADIVVLNQNPLLNIENTMDINLIIKGGKAYTSKNLLEKVPTEEEMEKYTNQLIEQFKELQLM